MEALENSIKDFFLSLEIFSNEWIEKAKSSEYVFSGLRNQSDQLKLLDRCNWSTDLLDNFPDIQAKLQNKIFNGIEEEVSKLTEICKSLLSMKKQLSAKLELIDKNSYKQNLASYTTYGEIAPGVYKFIEHAEDVMRYYRVLYIEIDHALACLDYKDIKTIDCTEEAFQKSVCIGEHIKANKLGSDLPCVSLVMFSMGWSLVSELTTLAAELSKNYITD